MPARRFTLDADLLVRAIDCGDPVRHARARDIVDRAVERDCVLTLQALGEFYATVARAGAAARHAAAQQVRDWLSLFPTVAVSTDAVAAALRWSQKAGLDYDRALFLSSAKEAGCGFVIGGMAPSALRGMGVRVLDPFASPALPAEVARLLA